MYFDKGGPDNTEKALDLAFEAARDRGLKHIVFATSTGSTAKAFLKRDISAFNIVCVTHAYGQIEKGQNEVSDILREELKAAGIKVLTTTHVLSGAERGLQRKFGGEYPVEIIAHTLRMLSAGIKVCVEIPVMALDAGLIPYGEKIVAVGGTNRGADTVAIVSPAHANAIFDTRIHEIICKPL
ncbi:hypothetical protein LQZ19_01655 [Treponema primitia]|uniref:pyruvate kinase alpha/beta domain-containing protein n=1 Tax=Treponema primitia TaxID=88058 RepID=UPI00397FDC73